MTTPAPRTIVQKLRECEGCRRRRERMQALMRRAFASGQKVIDRAKARQRPREQQGSSE